MRRAERCHLHREIKSLNFSVDAQKKKTSPFLWRTQREMLFPCRKYVAKVTEESERASGAAISPEYQGCRCRRRAQRSTLPVFVSCSLHMLLELYSSRLLRRHTAVLALSVAAVFESQPQSHLWSSVGLCFHFFFSPPILPLPIYRWCFFLCSLQTLIFSLSVNLRAASSEQPELTAPLRSTARRASLPESLKDNVTLWRTPNINYPRRSFMQQKLRV